MFTFLSPLFLIGLLSAVIPLIIHLSRSRRTKKIRFSTTRFLTDRFLRSYRMSRLKELLLLATRMALCAFFAMALAQPLLLPQGQTFLPGQSRSVVLVVDDSASMGYVEDGVSLLERARTAAREVIDGLGVGDTASIVLAGRRAAGPEVLFPQLTPELGDVRQAIDSVEAASLGSDLTQAIDRAEQLVGSSQAQSKEIFVFSDLQDAAWQRESDENKDGRGSDVLFFFTSVRPKSPRNLAVTAVQYAASRPMVGVPFSIQPHVRNQSDGVLNANVEMFVDGKKVGEQRVDKLQMGRWAVPKFHHTFHSGGWHSGYVQIDDESLAADNRRYFAFEVLDSIKVLAVNGASSAVPRLDELFFLKTALTASVAGQSPTQVDVVAPANLTGSRLADYPLVILANVESLSARSVEKLEEYVDQGGSLLVFLGDKTNQAFYNQTLAGANRLHGGLLPARLEGLEGDPAAEQHSAFIGQIDFAHAALSAFGEGKAGDLSSVTLRALWSVAPGESSVLMRASTGSPLLCEKAFGKGRVLLFTSTCDRDWTNFPVRPAFLPWIYRTVGYLAQGPLGRQNFFATGDSVPVPVSATQGLRQLLVKKPDGGVGHVAATTSAAAPMGFDDTEQPGVYELYAPGGEDKPQMFVANLEPYESDLTFLDDVLADRPGEEKFSSREAKIEAGLKELLPGRPLVAYVEKPERITQASLEARRGLKLWDMLLLAALVIALVEPWLANRISVMHYLKPRELPEMPRAAPRPPTATGPQISTRTKPGVREVSGSAP